VSDPTAHKARLDRAEKWLKDKGCPSVYQWLLVQYEEYLMECEAKRQSK
jgi:hypothetical protein